MNATTSAPRTGVLPAFDTTVNVLLTPAPAPDGLPPVISNRKTAGGAMEVEATYTRAIALCRHAGLLDQAFPALYGRLRHCMDQGNNARAQELAEEMLRLAANAGNAAFVVGAHSGLGAALVMQGKHGGALPHLEAVVAMEATAELRAILHPHVLVDPWVAAHSFLSLALLLLGPEARTANHRDIAGGLAETPERGRAADELAALYEMARYDPAAGELRPADAAAAAARAGDEPVPTSTARPAALAAPVGANGVPRVISSFNPPEGNDAPSDGTTASSSVLNPTRTITRACGASRLGICPRRISTASTSASWTWSSFAAC